MKTKITLITFLLLMAFSASFAQSPADTIQTVKKIGTAYYYKGKVLSMKKLKNLTNDVPETAVPMKMASRNYNWSAVFGGLGGGCIGFTIGYGLATGEYYWSMVAVGAGLIAVSIPFAIASKKHSKQAVGIYNDEIKKKAGNDVGFNFHFSPAAFGVVMKF